MWSVSLLSGCRIHSLPFKVAYQRILQLTYVDELLSALKTLFIKLFQPIIATFVASLHAVNSGKVLATEAASSFNFAAAFEGWDKVFDKLLKGFEDKAALVWISPYSVFLLTYS